MKLERNTIITIVVCLIIIGLFIFYRNKVNRLLLNLKDELKHCQQTPQLGELNTMGIKKFQLWVNTKYNTNVNMDGIPDDDTTEAYSQYGRDFLADLVGRF